jgi:hypothetical protein
VNSPSIAFASATATPTASVSPSKAKHVAIFCLTAFLALGVPDGPVRKVLA